MLLKKLVSGAVPVGVALVAYLHAQAIGALVDGSDPPASIAPFAEARAGQVEMSDAGRTAAALLERNPFDHETGAIAPSPSAAATDDPFAAPACEDVRAIATVRGSDDDGSFAALETTRSKMLRRRGDVIDDRRVVFVAPDRVWLERSGVLCQAQVLGRPSPGDGAEAAPVVEAPPRAGSRREKLEKEVTAKVRRVGPNEYEIERAAIDLVLEAQTELARAPMVPEREGDRVVGFRLLQIKPGSVLAAIGLETNDRLVALNGIEMTDTERMLEAYAKVRASAVDRITLTAVRRGKTVNLDYRVK